MFWVKIEHKFNGSVFLNVKVTYQQVGKCFPINFIK